MGGLSVSSIQMTHFCFSTELKTRFVTQAYDFCAGESFAAETNLRSSGYVMFFLRCNSSYLYFYFEEIAALGGSHVRLTAVTTHDVIVAIEAFMVFLSTLKRFSFPLHWQLPCPNS